MSRYHHYIHTAQQLLSGYRAPLPFHLYLKQYFSRHRQFGSRDRKLVSALCYSVLRAGHALKKSLQPDQLAIAYFLSDKPDSHLLHALAQNWEYDGEATTEEKLHNLGSRFDPDQLFPWKELLSPEIHQPAYSVSLLHQPGFFARIRPGYETFVLQKAATLTPPPTRPAPGCLRFPPGFDLEPHFRSGRELVIQDLQSQHTLDTLPEMLKQQVPGIPRVWDCCAASGGKSILVHDLLGGRLDLTVSDIRNSILHNLYDRFRQAGITNYRSVVCDLEKPASQIPDSHFDCVICDAPCTGSGTWGRTPEQLYCFDPLSLNRFTSRQLTIARHALHKLRKGGVFVYITCSVFSAENEAVVQQLVQDGKVELTDQRYLQGFDQGADTLFTACFRKTG